MEFLYLLVGLALGAFLVGWSSQKEKKELLEKEERARHDCQRAELRLESITENQEGSQAILKQIANEALEGFREKTKGDLGESRKDLEERLGNLLNPLTRDLEGFRKRVDETHAEGEKSREVLKEKMKGLSDLSALLQKETQGLTNALSGQTSAQGEWGQMVLESLLEMAGLQEGRQYTKQGGLKNPETGERNLRPDVIVHLPHGRQILIDSKVSMTAYLEYTKATGDREREEAFGRHLTSMRNHLKGLGKKRYELADGVRTLDFVVMFVAPESAYIEAISADDSLYQLGLAQNIVMACPGTILALLRTVETAWRQEDQSQNAREIAKRGGMLYDKFVLFAESLLEVGARLGKAQVALDKAFGQLKTGQGNLVGQVEKLKRLGVQATKSLPEGLACQEGEDDEEEPQ